MLKKVTVDYKRPWATLKAQFHGIPRGSPKTSLLNIEEPIEPKSCLVSIAKL